MSDAKMGREREPETGAIRRKEARTRRENLEKIKKSKRRIAKTKFGRKPSGMPYDGQEGNGLKLGAYGLSLTEKIKVPKTSKGPVGKTIQKESVLSCRKD